MHVGWHKRGTDRESKEDKKTGVKKRKRHTVKDLKIDTEGESEKEKERADRERNESEREERERERRRGERGEGERGKENEKARKNNR